MGIAACLKHPFVKPDPVPLDPVPLHGKREISADTALRLGKYFGIEPEFWLNLQVRYNMKIAKEKAEKKIETEVKVYRRKPNGLEPSA